MEAKDEELEHEHDDEGAHGAEDGMGGVLDVALADELTDPLDGEGDDGGEQQGQAEAQRLMVLWTGLDHLQPGEEDGVAAEHAKRAAEGRDREKAWAAERHRCAPEGVRVKVARDDFTGSRNGSGARLSFR